MNSLPSSQANAGPRAATNWTGVAFGLALAALAAFQLFKLPPALPLMLRSYGYDRILAGGFMSVFALVGLVLSLRIARGLERRGARPYLIAAFVLFLCGEALALAFPENGWIMLLARAFEGVGYAVCAILGPLLANLNSGRAHLPLVIGLTATWIPVGQVSANLISLPIVGRGLWQPLWLIGIGLTLALAAWAFALRKNPVVNAAPARRDGRKATPMTGAEKRALLIVATIFALWSGQYHAYMTWLPQFLVEVHGFGAAAAVLAYTVPAAAVLVFCVITGWALRAGAPLVPLFAGSIAVQVAVWFLVPLSGDGIAGMVSLAAYGISSGITPVCLFAMPSAVMGHSRVDATAFGTIMAGRNVGVLIGPVLLALAISFAADWHYAWPIFGTLTLMAGLLVLVLGRHLRRLGATG